MRAEIAKIAWRHIQQSLGPGFRKRQYTRESKEPFRERVIEERFVEETCCDNQCNYFLITRLKCWVHDHWRFYFTRVQRVRCKTSMPAWLRQRPLSRVEGVGTNGAHATDAQGWYSKFPWLKYKIHLKYSTWKMWEIVEVKGGGFQATDALQIMENKRSVARRVYIL